MTEIITTTTNSIEGYKIVKYYNPISSNIVIGSNLFSDLSASLTDIFGGRSSAYEKKLQLIFQNSIDNLNAKAKLLGANCIVGLKTDIDEISGKGTQMFMITAVGTPVKAYKENEETRNESESIIDGSDLINKIKSKNIIEAYENDLDISEKSFGYIIETKSVEFASIVLDFISRLPENLYPESDNKLKLCHQYFSLIDKNEMNKAIYAEIIKSENKDNLYISRLLDILYSYRGVDYNLIKEILKSDQAYKKKAVLKLFKTYKDAYTKSDINQLLIVRELITQAFPKQGEITTKKKMLSSSEKEVWKCTCTTVNDIDIVYCNSCRKDVYGFLASDIKPVSALRDVDKLIETLSEMV